MPARSWTQVLTPADLERTRKTERSFNPEYSIDARRFGDPHTFDRATVADFLAAVPSGLAGRLVALYRERAPFAASSTGQARRSVIDGWVRDARGGLVAQDRLSGAAGQYLDARGYPMQALLDLAQPLQRVLDGVVVRHGEFLPDRAEAHDTLDYVLACLLAGLTADEIAPLIETGNWPPMDTLDLLQALT